MDSWFIFSHQGHLKLTEKFNGKRGPLSLQQLTFQQFYFWYFCFLLILTCSRVITIQNSLKFKQQFQKQNQKRNIGPFEVNRFQWLRDIFITDTLFVSKIWHRIYKEKEILILIDLSVCGFSPHSHLSSRKCLFCTMFLPRSLSVREPIANQYWFLATPAWKGGTDKYQITTEYISMRGLSYSFINWKFYQVFYAMGFNWI